MSQWEHAMERVIGLLDSALVGVLAGAVAGAIAVSIWLRGDPWLAFWLLLGVLPIAASTGALIGSRRSTRLVYGAIFHGALHRGLVIFCLTCIVASGVFVTSLGHDDPRKDAYATFASASESAKTALNEADLSLAELRRLINTALGTSDRAIAGQMARDLGDEIVDRASMIAVSLSQYFSLTEGVNEETSLQILQVAIPKLQIIPDDIRGLTDKTRREINKLNALLLAPGPQIGYSESNLHTQLAELNELNTRLLDLPAKAARKQLVETIRAINAFYSESEKLRVETLRALLDAESVYRSLFKSDEKAFENLPASEKEQLVKAQQEAVAAIREVEKDKAQVVRDKIVEATARIDQWEKSIADAADPLPALAIDEQPFWTQVTRAQILIRDALFVADLAKRAGLQGLPEEIASAAADWQSTVSDYMTQWNDALESFRSQAQTNTVLKDKLVTDLPGIVNKLVDEWQQRYESWREQIPTVRNRSWDEWDDLPDILKFHPGAIIMKAFGGFGSGSSQQILTEYVEALSNDRVPGQGMIRELLGLAETPGEKVAILRTLRANADEARRAGRLTQEKYEETLSLLAQELDNIENGLKDLNETAYAIYMAIKANPNIETAELIEKLPSKDPDATPSRRYQTASEKLAVERALGAFESNVFYQKHWIDGGMRDIPVLGSPSEGGSE